MSDPRRHVSAQRPEFTVRVMPVAFSPKQFEEAYGVGHTKLYEEIKAGRLVARKLGKRTLILASDAEAWAMAQRAMPDIDTQDKIPSEALSDVGSVYFIRAGIRGPIKIGKANVVAARLASLQTAHHEKLIVLGWMPGGAFAERLLLNRFSHLRIRGEWHRADQELLKFIRRCACHG